MMTAKEVSGTFPKSNIGIRRKMLVIPPKSSATSTAVSKFEYVRRIARSGHGAIAASEQRYTSTQRTGRLV
jgi:hypothetical protein